MRRIRRVAALVVSLVMASCAPRAPVTSTSAPSASDRYQQAGLDTPTTQVMSTDFALESLDGARVRLSSYKGKVILLSFWATWCVPCRQEMPAMQKLYDSLRSRGLEIVAVDVMEDKATVVSFINKAGYTFPVLLDTEGKVSGMYGAQGIPTNYIIDRAGSIRARVVGIGGPEWTSRERMAVFDQLLSP